jgi:hypothetical protein
MNHCTSCGAALEPGAAFCAQCGSSVGGAGGGYGGGERQASTFMNIARGAKGLALLGFLLPWVTVSCANQPLLRASGLEMMTGSARPVERPAMRGAGGDGGLGNLMPSGSQVDVFIIAAAVLIIAGLVLSFVLARRQGALAGMIASAAAALIIIYEVLIRLKGAVADAIQENAARSGGATKGPAGLGEPDMEQLARMISVDPGIGFWVTLFALIAAAVLFAMASRRPPGSAY